MTTTLLIDDDVSLLDILSMAFEDAGYTVVTAVNGLAGLEVINSNPDVELIVCDVNMPGLDGFSLCRQLRQMNIELPFILLTSRDTEVDEALGLELGADDFVTKPFSTRVLLARVSALLRRERIRGGGESALEPVEVGALTIDSARISVTYKGTPVSVTVTEFKLLEALATRPEVVLSRERLLDLVRGDDSVVADRIIDTYVRRLRRKVEAIDPDFNSIQTVVGAGYRWMN